MTDFIHQSSTYHNSVLLGVSRLFERMGYYGFRSVFILFLLSASVGMSEYEAYTLYGTLTGLIYVSKLFGGVIGDLAIGSRLAIISGSGLQALGVLALFIPGYIGLYTGITLIILGAGFYEPNVLAAFGKTFYHTKKYADSGFGFFYIAVNIGAVLGILSVSYLFEISITFALLGSVLLYVVGAVVALTTDAGGMIATGTEPKPYSASATGGVLISIAIVASGVYWALFELATPTITYTMYSIDPSIFEGFNLEVSDVINNLNASVIVIFGGILSVVWLYFKSSSVLKIAIGFFLSAIAMVLVVFMPEFDAGIGVMMLIIHTIVMAIGEFLIVPPILSVIATKSNPKYMAIVMAVFSLVTYIIIAGFRSVIELLGIDLYAEDVIYIGVASSILVVIGIGLVVTYAVTTSSTSQTLDDID